MARALSTHCSLRPPTGHPTTPRATSAGGHALATDDQSITVSYTIAGLLLPVADGDELAVTLRQVQPFGTAHGLALLDTAGKLLALVDDGGFGSAWSSSLTSNPEPAPGGFTVRQEPAGCTPQVAQCVFVEHQALRFSHMSGGEVVVPSGETRVLVTGDGAAYRVVNAVTESFTPRDGVSCTDLEPRAAWAILAE